MSQKQQDSIEQKVSSQEVVALAPPPTSSLPDTPQSEVVQEQEDTSEAPQDTEQPQSPPVTSGKKRGKKKGRLVNVEEIMPKPSYWPLALAVSFVVLSMGIVISWIVIAIGAVLMIASVMGWALERR